LSFLNTNSGAVTAIATLLIAIFTATLWYLSRQQIAITRAIERAYISLSHKSPENGNALAIQGNQAFVTIAVTNHGRTPADILGGRMKLERLGKDQRLPSPPNYHGPDSCTIDVAYFLVSDSHFFVNQIQLPFPSNYAPAIESGDEILRLYGYVDYVDRFGQAHRAGYARRYAPGVARNNLVFETAPGYNYDKVTR